MLAVTGANGHLGLRLLQSYAARRGRRAASVAAGFTGRDDDQPVRALVRSRHSADALTRRCRGSRAVDVCVVDYAEPDDLARALAGCSAVAHLVGIVKEDARSRYRDAHQVTCAALARAAAVAGVRRIVYPSIVGAAAPGGNACLVSRGHAERILWEGSVPVTILRLPMVLGEGDFAARALSARARRRWNLVLRGASLEQPIYAGDVVAAVLAALGGDAGSHCYDLAGPESLPRSELIRRAARRLGRRTRVLSLPLWLGMAAASLIETLTANPPVTRAMLGVLDHDDCVDVQPALDALGVALTPLDETLERCLAAPGADA